MLATQFNPSADDNSSYLSGMGYDYALLKAFFDDLNMQMSTQLAELGNSDRLEATIIYGSETLQVYVDHAKSDRPHIIRVNAEGKSEAHVSISINSSLPDPDRTVQWISSAKLAIHGACRDAGLFFTLTWGSEERSMEEPLFQV